QRQPGVESRWLPLDRNVERVLTISIEAAREPRLASRLDAKDVGFLAPSLRPPECGMSNEHSKLLVSCYAGAYGPTLRIDLQSLAVSGARLVRGNGPEDVRIDWRMPRDAWEHCLDLLGPLVTGGTPAHQYLTEERSGYLLVELAFRGPRPAGRKRGGDPRWPSRRCSRGAGASTARSSTGGRRGSTRTASGRAATRWPARAQSVCARSA